MVRILVPAALKQYTGESKIQASIGAKSVSGALDRLIMKNKRLAKCIIVDKGKLRNISTDSLTIESFETPFVRVYESKRR